MKPVEIYTTKHCWYCARAKELLEARDIEYTEHPVDGDMDERARLRRVTGQQTVPQIFIGGEPIGGCSELQSLIRLGKLDGLLAEGEP